MAHPVLGHSLWKTIFTVLFIPPLFKSALNCAKAVIVKFFILQYKAKARFIHIPVSSVDHPLDKKIPFTPSWVGIYLDFIEFWVQIVGFLLKQYGKKAILPAKEVIDTTAALYGFAAEVYSKHMSTTERPKYYKTLRFLTIHIADPHLMCIPSLHVMMAVHAYTKFRQIIRTFGDEEKLSREIRAMNEGALKIAEAVLYVKQHSVNCISAAMYAMTCFDAPLFSRDEARNFVNQLYIHEDIPNKEDAALIREHIFSLYEQFVAEGKNAAHWGDPLIRFLEEYRANGEMS